MAVLLLLVRIGPLEDDDVDADVGADVGADADTGAEVGPDVDTVDTADEDEAGARGSLRFLSLFHARNLRRTIARGFGFRRICSTRVEILDVLSLMIFLGRLLPCEGSWCERFLGLAIILLLLGLLLIGVLSGLLVLEVLGIDAGLDGNGLDTLILSELIFGIFTVCAAGFGVAGFADAGFIGTDFGRGLGGAGLGKSTLAGAGFVSSAAGRSSLTRTGVETEMLSLCSMGAAIGIGGAAGAGVCALTTGLAVIDCLRGSSAALTIGEAVAILVAAATTLGGTLMAPVIGRAATGTAIGAAATGVANLLLKLGALLRLSVIVRLGSGRATDAGVAYFLRLFVL